MGPLALEPLMLHVSQMMEECARAKGVREAPVLLRHVLRNSLIPVVTVIALGLPTIFGGAIVTLVPLLVAPP